MDRTADTPLWLHPFDCDCTENHLAGLAEAQRILLEAYWEADMDVSRFAFRVLHAIDPEKFK